MKKESKAKGRPKLKGSAVPRRTAFRRPEVLFPIVGIGASAGGLEALEHFLRRVPTRSGMGFVIVQHLDPTHKGVMPELLQRATSMKVVQVKDRTRVQPDWVYVIPPNKDMSILHGVLHLLPPAAPRGLRLPIDFFLRSLAQDQQERSIGVILSGMGSDGTLGLRAIKEKAGLVLVQEAGTAKFDGMPRSVIDAGLADIIAPAEELPAKILAYLRRTPLNSRAEPAIADKTQSAMEKAVILLRAHAGHDFSLYKRNTLYRRIERRMGIHQIGKIADYVRYLQENPPELDLLFKELLIGVTNFFRDPAVWARLRDHVLAELLRTRSGQALRAWVPGCATGEEAYSLAIIFKEMVGRLKPKASYSLQIFATDLDKDAIDKARQALFSDNIATDVSPDRLSRFFAKEDQGYRVRKEIREMVIFAPQNLVMDPPFTKLDILSCRNLLIYLTPEVQKKLLPLFHYSLHPDGILVLGSAESISGFTSLFVPVDVKSRIFRRSDSGMRPEPIEFPSAFSSLPPGRPAPAAAPTPPASLQSLTDQLVLQSYSPPCVLVNDRGDILYISGRTGKYLEPAAGKANWNIFAMARQGLRYELTSAFQEALRQKGTVTLRGLSVGAATDASEQRVDIAVQPLEQPETLRGLVLVAFSEVAQPRELKAAGRPRKAPASNPRLALLERELQQLRESLRTTREEMQSSQEELKSTNEELQSANEELQSTNEELTTSKEEMQSLNEELQTLNTELQARVDDLSTANSDMRNLLNSTEIATVFLDNNLNVRRFTVEATNLFKLIPGDVGRPITDLASELRYPDLARDTHEVLRTLTSADKRIATSDGRWFKVRIMPYRTMDNRIEGVVITFTDVSASRQPQAGPRSSHTDRGSAAQQSRATAKTKSNP